MSVKTHCSSVIQFSQCDILSFIQSFTDNSKIHHRYRANGYRNYKIYISTHASVILKLVVHQVTRKL